VALAREDITPPFAPVLLARIPAGQFIMGSPVTEAGHEADEWPRTTVILAADFWMSIYEITQAQYRNIMGTNPSWFSTYNTLPVEQVSWDEASEFCHRLTEHEDQAGRLPAGYAYRLPTEAEWEYAARAGSTNQFSYGDDPGYAKISDYAWDKYSSFGTTHAVGTKKPNGWGLYDLSGNVLEWCLDWYGDYPGGQVRNPTGPAEGDFRVMRGGSFYDTGEFCRPAFRLYDWTDDRFYNVGFRVVLAQKVLP
jgi:formylglycine-generating enzyme required for sulfatase activity